MKWVVLTLLVLAAALALQMGLLAFGIYALLAIALISRWLVQSSVRQITIERSVSEHTAEVGDRVRVVLRVRNNSGIPIPWLLVQDVMSLRAISGTSPAMRVDGQRIRMTMLWPHQTRLFHYELTCLRRGHFQIGPALLETGDLFGLFRKFRLADEPEYLLVYPHVVPLLGYDVASQRPVGEVVMTHRLYEDPTRIAGVRDYQPGDPLNRVHWKATARVLSLQSKTYEPSSIAGATLIVDFQQSVYRKEDEPVRSELSVTAAAAIAHLLFEMGEQICLVSNGRDAADRIRVEGFRVPRITRKAARRLSEDAIREARLQPVVSPTGRGPVAFSRIWELLARLELNRGLRFDQLLWEAGSRISRDTTALAILGDVAEYHVLALDELVRRGFAVTAVLNEHDEDRFRSAAGSLIAAGIEVHRILDESSISQVCRRMALK